MITAVKCKTSDHTGILLLGGAARTAVYLIVGSSNDPSEVRRGLTEVQMTFRLDLSIEYEATSGI